VKKLLLALSAVILGLTAAGQDEVPSKVTNQNRNRVGPGSNPAPATNHFAIIPGAERLLFLLDGSVFASSSFFFKLLPHKLRLSGAPVNILLFRRHLPKLPRACMGHPPVPWNLKRLARLLLVLLGAGFACVLPGILLRVAEIFLPSPRPEGVWFNFAKDGIWLLITIAYCCFSRFGSSQIGLRHPDTKPNWVALAIGVTTLSLTISSVGLYWGVFSGYRIGLYSWGSGLLELVIVTSVVEEAFFRGWFQAALQEIFESNRVIVLTNALFFGVLHLPLTSGEVEMAAVVGVFSSAVTLGLITAHLRRVYVSLYPAMFAHATYNLAGFVLVKGLLS
jgi:membrane protease YdiL (CAAX protease family)